MAGLIEVVEVWKIGWVRGWR